MLASPEGWPDDGPANRLEGHRMRYRSDPPMPHIESGSYLLSMWVDMGKVEKIPGAGLRSIPFSEIASAYPWTNSDERVLINSMSREFLAGMQIGESPFGRPPWEPEYD